MKRSTVMGLACLHMLLVPGAALPRRPAEEEHV